MARRKQVARSASTSTDEAPVGKRPKTVHKPEKHLQFAITYYANHMGCASYQDFEAALPDEFWNCEDLEAFPKHKLRDILFPKLQSENGAGGLQAVKDTICFFEKILDYVEAYHPPDGLLLRRQIDLLRAVPHEPQVYKIVLDIADPIVRRLRENAEEQKAKAKTLTYLYLKGGAATAAVHHAAMELARTQEEWWCFLHLEWKSFKSDIL